MAVNAGMLPATLGAQAAHVAAGGGMLQHVRRRVSVQVRMRPKGIASAWTCGTQRVSGMCKLSGCRGLAAAPFVNAHAAMPESRNS